MAFTYWSAHDLSLNKETAALDVCGKLVAAGWSYVSGGTGYKTYRSNGESGAEIYMYVSVDWQSSLKISLHSWWTSLAMEGANADVMAITLGLPTYFYCSKDGLVMFQSQSGALLANGVIMRVTPPTTGQILCRLTATPDYGTNKILTVGSTAASFEVGRKYQIFGYGSGYRHTFTCVAKTASTITADTLPSDPYNIGNLAIGSWVGTNPHNVVFGVGTLFPTYSLNHHRCTGFESPTLYPTECKESVTSTLYNAYDMPAINGEYIRGLFYAQCVEHGGSPASFRYIGSLEQTLNWYFQIPPLSSTLYENDTITAASFDAIAINAQISSTFTGPNTSTTVYDSTVDFDANQGVALVITSGAGAGQIRTRVASDTHELTITPAFTIVPNAGDSYVVTYEAYRYVLQSVGLLLREAI